MSLDYRYYDQYAAILNVIDDADDQRASKPMIQDALNLSHGTIFKRINELVKAGVLEASNSRPVFYSLGDTEAWDDLGKLRLADDLKNDGEEEPQSPLSAPSAPVGATMVTSAPEEPVEAPTPLVPVRTPLEWVENAEVVMRHDLDRPALLFVNIMPGDIKDLNAKLAMLEAMSKADFVSVTGGGGYWRGFDSVDEAMLVKLRLEGSAEFPYAISLVERPSKTIESVIANAVAEAALISTLR